MSPAGPRADDVAVTGMGVVSPLGNDVPTFTRRMLAGDSGVRSLRGWLAPEGFPVPYGGVVCRETLAPAGRPPGEHSTALADCAASPSRRPRRRSPASPPGCRSTASSTAPPRG